MNQNEKVVIGLIVLNWIFILSVMFKIRKEIKINAKIKGLDINVEIACPPHSWKWEEQLGMEKPTYYIRCQRCRRLPGWDTNNER